MVQRGFDGDLYVPKGNQIYKMTPAVDGFTQVFSPLAQAAAGGVGYGGKSMTAWTPPAGSGAAPLLWVVTSNDAGQAILASTPMSGSGAGTWTYYDPIDPSGASCEKLDISSHKF